MDAIEPPIAVTLAIACHVRVNQIRRRGAFTVLDLVEMFQAFGWSHDLDPDVFEAGSLLVHPLVVRDEHVRIGDLVSHQVIDVNDFVREGLGAGGDFGGE